MKPARIAARMGAIQPFHVMALLGRARELEAQGRSIVHMEIGEPDFATPAPVIAAGQRALAEGRTHYTPSLGLPELREAIARHYREKFHVAVDPRRIVITTGGSGALLLALGVLVNGGDRVLVSDPGYPCNRHFVRLLEGEPVSVPVDADDRFQLQASHVERHWDARTVAAMVATPSNPTGTVLSRVEMAALIEAVHARNGRLIVDEIYQGLVYDTPPQEVVARMSNAKSGEFSAPQTTLGLNDELFIINSFSKYFCMTGWRLGWMVVPDEYVEPVERLAQNLYLAPPTPSQYAALAAFSPESVSILESYRAEFRRRRDWLVPALERLGFRVTAVPQGAFYIYADCSAISPDSFELSRRLLEEAGVAITPGNDFGTHGAAHHVRFAYTTSLENLTEGIRRLEKALSA